MARQYIKRNKDYWDSLSNPKPTSTQTTATITPTLEIANLSLVEGSYEDSYIRGEGGRIINTNRSKNTKYPLIDELPLPFEDRKGVVCVSRAIELSTKLFFGFAAYRNVIRALVEFCSTKVHFKCNKSKTTKEAVEKWAEHINHDALQEQVFRDYFVKANVFAYEFRGQIRKEDTEKLETALGAKLAKNGVPIRYVLLNPMDIGVQNAMFVDRSYVKIFSPYEIGKLRQAKPGSIEAQMIASFPPEIKEQIKNSRGNSHITLQLDPDRLSFLFYERQDYEALGVPFVWGVLDDIELKLALKKMDKTLARTMENLILLVTHGAKPEEGGINKANHESLINLFKNHAVARIIVADYTTKAEFVVPDIKEILGEAKYAQVNADIREGLGAFLTGDSKFADATMKARVFLQRIEKAQKFYDKEFLWPKVKDFCDSMGLRYYPKIVRERIDLEDPNVRARVITRLAELGILTGPDTLKVMENGVFPDEETNKEHQEEYKKDRDKGLFLPLIGGSTSAQMAAGRPQGTSGIKKSSNRVGITGTQFTPKELKTIVAATNALYAKAMDLIKDENDIPDKKDYAVFLTQEIVKNAPFDKWEETLINAVKASVPPPITDITREVTEISEEFECDEYGAALIVHARHLKNE